jgi:ATP-dependent DNA ligase
VQLHKGGASTAIYSRNGGDLSRRFPRIAAAVLGRPAKSCIIDDELIAAGVHGEPIFSHCCTDGHVPTCVYAFDLLELQGRRSSWSSTRVTARGFERCRRAKSDLLRFKRVARWLPASAALP